MDFIQKQMKGKPEQMFTRPRLVGVKFNITEKIILITNNVLHTITWGKYLNQVICNIATLNKRGPMK